MEALYNQSGDQREGTRIMYVFKPVQHLSLKIPCMLRYAEPRAVRNAPRESLYRCQTFQMRLQLSQ